MTTRFRSWLPAALIAATMLFPLAGCGGTQKVSDEALEQSEYHYGLAVGHFSAHEVPIAIRELFMALEFNPDNAHAHFLLGFIYQGRRDYPTALEYYDRAITLQPGWHEVLNNIGTIYLEQRDWDRAATLFRDLSRVPTYQTPGHAWNNLGWALYNQGHVHDAREYFQLAVEYQPEHCLAWNNLGLTHEELGNMRDAQRSYEQAIRRCSRYAEPRYRLGTMLYRNGTDHRRAIELLRECVDMAPESNYGDRCMEFLALEPEGQSRPRGSSSRR